MTDLLILGRGFLGSRFASAFPGSTLAAIDICDPRALARAFAESKPRVVINAAGKTGRPNVDWCEVNQVDTYRSNVIGALLVAEAAGAAGAHLIHIGSGCVFYGPCPHREEGWGEEDTAHPASYYSRTKYAADLALSGLPRVCIVRIRMPVDHVPGPRNLITKLAAYPQVIDVENSVTVVDDLVMALRKLIEARAEGLFHVTNPGGLRHRELLDAYRELVSPSHKVNYIAADELVSRGLALKERSTTRLASSRLEAVGIRLRPIRDALRATMVMYASIVGAAAHPTIAASFDLPGDERRDG